MNINVKSLLDPIFRDELEDLLFFHPHQGNFRRNIIASVEKYGTPRLVEENGVLRVQLPRLSDVQTLYAVKATPKVHPLLGVIVYTRTSDGEFDILHIAVREEYTFLGGKDGNSVAFLLIEELCHIGRQVKGIRAVRLAYNRGKVIIRSI